MAVAVVDLLEAVEVEKQQGNWPPVAGGSFSFTAQYQVEVARVVEAGQVISYRQRLSFLERQGVVERNGRRLEECPQCDEDRRSERRNRGRGLGIQAHEG